MATSAGAWQWVVASLCIVLAGGDGVGAAEGLVPQLRRGMGMQGKHL